MNFNPTSLLAAHPGPLPSELIDALLPMVTDRQAAAALLSRGDLSPRQAVEVARLDTPDLASHLINKQPRAFVRSVRPGGELEELVIIVAECVDPMTPDGGRLEQVGHLAALMDDEQHQYLRTSAGPEATSAMARVETREPLVYVLRLQTMLETDVVPPDLLAGVRRGLLTAGMRVIRRYSIDEAEQMWLAITDGDLLAALLTSGDMRSVSPVAVGSLTGQAAKHVLKHATLPAAGKKVVRDSLRGQPGTLHSPGSHHAKAALAARLLDEVGDDAPWATIVSLLSELDPAHPAQDAIAVVTSALR